MKKIWYLKDIKGDNSRAVKVFLYEKNGLPAGKLDLSAFREESENRDIVLRFQRDSGREIGSVELPKQMTAREAYLQGKGQLRENLVKSLMEEIGKVQLSASVGEKTYVSEGWIKEPPAQEESIGQETDRGEKSQEMREEVEKPREESREEPREEPRKDLKEEPRKGRQEEAAVPLEDSAENDAELEAEEFLPEDSAGKRFVQLAALEEELEFRRYVHNSFLLHGYYNYGHVVIDESGEGARLGVPGNYYKREQMVAEMFGFPDFVPARENERIVNGTFGYYFTPENR